MDDESSIAIRKAFGKEGINIDNDVLIEAEVAANFWYGYAGSLVEHKFSGPALSRGNAIFYSWPTAVFIVKLIDVVESTNGLSLRDIDDNSRRNFARATLGSGFFHGRSLHKLSPLEASFRDLLECHDSVESSDSMKRFCTRINEHVEIANEKLTCQYGTKTDCTEARCKYSVAVVAGHELARKMGIDIPGEATDYTKGL